MVKPKCEVGNLALKEIYKYNSFSDPKRKEGQTVKGVSLLPKRWMNDTFVYKKLITSILFYPLIFVNYSIYTWAAAIGHTSYTVYSSQQNEEKSLSSL